MYGSKTFCFFPVLLMHIVKETLATLLMLYVYPTVPFLFPSSFLDCWRHVFSWDELQLRYYVIFGGDRSCRWARLKFADALSQAKSKGWKLHRTRSSCSRLKISGERCLFYWGRVVFCSIQASSRLDEAPSQDGGPPALLAVHQSNVNLVQKHPH